MVACWLFDLLYYGSSVLFGIGRGCVTSNCVPIPRALPRIAEGAPGALLVLLANHLTERKHFREECLALKHSLAGAL